VILSENGRHWTRGQTNYDGKQSLMSFPYWWIWWIQVFIGRDYTPTTYVIKKGRQIAAVWIMWIEMYKKTNTRVNSLHISTKSFFTTKFT